MNKKDILNLNFDFDYKAKKSKDRASGLVKIISCNGVKLNQEQAYTLTDMLRQVNINAECQTLKNKKKITYLVCFPDNNFDQDNKNKGKKSGNKKQFKKKVKVYITDIKNQLLKQLKNQQSLTEAIHLALKADEEAEYTTLALKHKILPDHLDNFLMSIQAEYEHTDKHDVYKFDSNYYDNDRYSFEEHYELIEELQNVVNSAGDNAGMVSYQKEDNELDVHGNPQAVDINFWSIAVIKYR